MILQAPVDTASNSLMAVRLPTVRRRFSAGREPNGTWRAVHSVMPPVAEGSATVWVERFTEQRPCAEQVLTWVVACVTDDLGVADRAVRAAGVIWAHGSSGIRPGSAAAIHRMHVAGERFVDVAIDYARAWDALRAQCRSWPEVEVPPAPEAIVAVAERLAVEPVAEVRRWLLGRLADELVAGLRRA
jgi:hypothetical protein